MTTAVEIAIRVALEHKVALQAARIASLEKAAMEVIDADSHYHTPATLANFRAAMRLLRAALGETK